MAKEKASALPEIKGRHVLLKVGAKYESRTLGYAIQRALETGDLNGEQRVVLVSLYCQLRFHWARDKKKVE